ncbi:MAG: hypothetical protein Q8J78_01070 [Moraxellaceae bacterium]|nr:hypothetical protein [Moraxellaceae bacterium]
MAVLTIRNLDDELKARLRRLAAAHGRSMEEEARQILKQRLSVAEEASAGLGSRLHAQFKAAGLTEVVVTRAPEPPRAADFSE